MLSLLLTAMASLAALQPHQVALIVNQDSLNSMTLANHWRALRQVPVENVVYVSVPPESLRRMSQISSERFNEAILEPVQKTLRDRGVDDHILAWVYSADFPTRVIAETPVSLTGYTFVQGRLPSVDLIRNGRFMSPLFAGVDGLNRPPRQGYGFADLAPSLADRMPVPSMILAHMGTRGLTLPEALAVLERGREGDQTDPEGLIVFEVSEDVRSKARERWFDSAIEELAEKSVRAVAGPLPRREAGLLGVLAGRPMVAPHHLGSYRPGAYADHFTSFAAEFHQYHQNKCTEWLRHGATATAGTVLEPMAIWTKWPSPRIYVFLAEGLSMIESLYNATASPLETLFMGEPLCAPFLRVPLFMLIALSDGPYQGMVTFHNQPVMPVGVGTYWSRFFLDGKELGPAGSTPQVEIDTRLISDGFHVLEAEAFPPGQIGRTVSSRRVFEVQNQQRTVRAEAAARTDLWHPWRVDIEADDDAVSVGVRVQGRELIRVPGAQAQLDLDPLRFGLGPVEWQAVAIYSDRSEIRSEPFMLEVNDLNQPPEIIEEEALSLQGEERTLLVRFSDPEGDALQAQSWTLLNAEPFFPSGEEGEDQGVATWVSPTHTPSVGLWGLTGAVVKAVSAEFTPFPDADGPLGAERFGLVFQYQSASDFLFFGYGGQSGAWGFSQMKAGVWTDLQAVGEPVFRGVSVAMSLHTSPEGTLEGAAGSGIRIRLDQPIHDLGRLGVLCQATVRIEKIGFSESPPRDVHSTEPMVFQFGPTGPGSGSRIEIQAWDRSGVRSSRIWTAQIK